MICTYSVWKDSVKRMMLIHRYSENNKTLEDVFVKYFTALNFLKKNMDLINKKEGNILCKISPKFLLKFKIFKKTNTIILFYVTDQI